MTRWRAPMTKFSHTSSKQPHKPVSHGVLEAYNFFGKTQNRMVNHQHTRNWKSFEKSWVFLSPSIVSFFTDFYPQFSFAYFARQWFFPMFSFEILRGNRRAGSESHWACPTFQGPLCYLVSPSNLKRFETGPIFSARIFESYASNMRIIKYNLHFGSSMALRFRWPFVSFEFYHNSKQFWKYLLQNEKKQKPQMTKH